MKDIEVIELNLDDLEISEEDFGKEAEVAVKDTRGVIDGE